MRVELLEAGAREAWDRFVASSSRFGLLQSWAWGEFQERRGLEVARVAVTREGAIVAGAQVLLGPPSTGRAGLAYISNGPLVDRRDDDLTRALFAAVHEVAHHHRASATLIEPPLTDTAEAREWLGALGFGPARPDDAQRFTVAVDLARDRGSIERSMHRSVRRAIRRSERSGLRVVEGDEADLPTLYVLLKRSAERSRSTIRPFEYYRDQWEVLGRSADLSFLVALRDGRAVAARIAAAFGSGAALLQLASRAEARGAGALLARDQLLWAHDRGCVRFDMRRVRDRADEILRWGDPAPHAPRGQLRRARRLLRRSGARQIRYVAAHTFAYTSSMRRLLECVDPVPGTADRLASLSDRLNPRI